MTRHLRAGALALLLLCLAPAAVLADNIGGSGWVEQVSGGWSTGTTTCTGGYDANNPWTKSCQHNWSTQYVKHFYDGSPDAYYTVYGYWTQTQQCPGWSSPYATSRQCSTTTSENDYTVWSNGTSYWSYGSPSTSYWTDARTVAPDTVSVGIACPLWVHIGSAFSCTAYASSSWGYPITSYSWSGASGTGSSASGTCYASFCSVSVTASDGTASGSASGGVSTTNNPPRVSASCTGTAYKGQTVRCSGSATDPDGDPLASWSWSGVSGTGNSASTTAGAPGSYTVSLTVCDKWGTCGTGSTTYTVANQPPSISLSCPASLKAGQSGTCTASATDPDDAIASYTWSGASGSGSTATFSRATAGRYGVTVTVCDTGGACSSASASIQVTANQPPSVSLSCPGTLMAYQSGTCTASASDPDDGIASYAWSGASGAGTTATFSRTAAGTYPVTVTVCDTGSPQACSSASANIVVRANQPPVVSLSCPAWLSISQSGTCTALASDPDDGIASYSWSGASGAGNTAAFIRPAAGTYTVTVTVCDTGFPQACSTASTPVAVVAPLTVSLTPAAITLGQGYSQAFQAVVSGGTSYSYSWTATGGPVNGAGPTYTTAWNTAGSYVVTLAVTDNFGRSGTAQSTVTVLPPLTISIWPATANLVAGQPATWAAQAAGGNAYTYTWWTTGQGTAVASGSGYTTTFTTAGSFTVGVRVTDDIGRTATVQATAHVALPPLTATLSPVSTSLAAGQPQSWTVTASGGNSYTYAWSATGSPAVTASGPAYTTTWNTPGTYTVTALVQDDHGRTVTLTGTATVTLSIVGVFSPSPVERSNPCTVTATTTGSPSQVTVTVGGITYAMTQAGGPDNWTLTLDTEPLEVGTYSALFTAMRGSAQATDTETLQVIAKPVDTQVHLIH